MDKILIDLKQEGLCSLRGEFEAEGMETFDIDFLNNLSFMTKLQRTFKIGGVEASTDLMFSLLNGANTVIAPMVESVFAVKKFIKNIDSITELQNLFQKSFAHKQISFAINIETKTAIDNLDDILNFAKHKIDKVVVGRVDLADSFGYKRKDIDIQNDKVDLILQKSKKMGFITSLGGGISFKTINFLEKLKEKKLLDYFETRKLVFDLNDLNHLNIAISGAIKFEKKYLELKQNYKKLMVKDIKKRLDILKNKLD